MAKKKKLIDTSIEALKSLDPDSIADIYNRIIQALSVLGQGTFEDISAYLKVDKSRIWKRLSELAKMGKIYRPGIKKILRSGRNGHVWMLTDGVLPKTEIAQRALKGKSVSDFSKEIINKPKFIPQPLFPTD